MDRVQPVTILRSVYSKGRIQLVQSMNTEQYNHMKFPKHYGVTTVVVRSASGGSLAPLKAAK